MGRCPKCKTKIKYLNFYSEVVQEFVLEKNEAEYNGLDYCEGGHFSCPECDEELTEDEDKAIKILKRK